MKKLVLLSAAMLLMYSCSSDDSGDTDQASPDVEVAPGEEVAEVPVVEEEVVEEEVVVEEVEEMPEEEPPVLVEERQLLTYDADVAPLIASRCFACHNDPTRNGAPRNSTWVNFDIVSANAALINARVASGSMPPRGGLVQAERDVIAQWIADGMLEN